MGVYTNIESALNVRLRALPSGPSICWPNVKYRPVENIPWIRPTLLPAQTNLYTTSGTQRHSGIYQIDVFVPLEKGTATLDSLLDEIDSHFASDLDLTAGSDTVLIQARGRGPATRQEAWYSSYIEIYYLCFS